MPQDSIMDWMDAEDAFRDERYRLYDRWVDQGDAWSIKSASKEAELLVRDVARTVESFDFVDDKYTPTEIRQAIDKLLEKFEEYRDEEIVSRMEEARRVATPEELGMDPGEVAHARKYEALAQEIGIERLKELIPISPEKVRKALDRGDKHLNSIPFLKWADAAGKIRSVLHKRKLSVSDGAVILKHVATWHYA